MADGPLLEEQRENWGSRAGFVLAAIGSAVGLGNLWGFPYKLYSHGGGAFLIPYVIAMVLIGLPLLIAEFSLGHLTQRATPDAFGRANRKFAFVGWWQIILSFVIITYYAVILAWCLSFLYYSVVGIFQGRLPWAGQGVEGVKNAKSFFFDEYLNFNGKFSLGRIQWHIILSLVVVWVGLYLCIFRGVRLVSKVVLWTVPLPWLMLGILTIRGLTLDGAVQGLEFYLEPNWTRLADPSTWRWAFGQMFFSMSLAFGIMITYASFLHRKSDINNNAAIIGLADMGTSFVAGLAVFATLGGMAYATQIAGAGIPVESIVDKGPSLAFVAFPYALAQLPHAAWFSLVFFSSLLLLGVDSAFSITESVLASIVDKTGWRRGGTLITLSLVGLVIGILFCTQGGLTWLGTFDDFINGTWGITLTALLECFVLGWLFRLRRFRAHANERSDWKIGVWWDWQIRVIIPMVLAALFAWSLFDNLSDPRGYVFKYKAGETTVNVPAVSVMPQRPVLHLEFVAEFNSKPEHAFTLDQKKAKESVKGWRMRDGEGEPIAEDFKTTQLVGVALTFTTAELTPRTAYTVRYRWASRPTKDAKTGMPVPAAKKDQPAWAEIASMTTPSIGDGVRVGNFAGVCLMGIAPILAIVISSLRFRRTEAEPVHTHYEDPRPRGRIGGAVALLVALAGLGALAVAFAEMFGASAQVRSTGAGGNVDMRTAVRALTIGGAGGLFALLVGGVVVWRMERRQIRASMASRLAAGAGVLAVGAGGGLGLAMWMIASRFAITPVAYDGELSTTSFLILAGMLGLIVVGLAWCFYRAIRSAGGKAELQFPDAEDTTPAPETEK